MRRNGMLAVPLASALVGAVAAGSVAWAAGHPAMVRTQASTSTTVTHPSQRVVVVHHGDDGGARRIVVVGNTASGTAMTAPATHTSSGASGALP